MIFTQSSLTKNSNLRNEIQPLLLNQWVQFNNKKTDKILNTTPKTIVIYSYSIPTNFIKEVFSKIGVKLILTNNFRQASLIIGLSHHLQSNLQLKQFALEKKIPIYKVDEISIYKLLKVIKVILSISLPEVGQKKIS